MNQPRRAAVLGLVALLATAIPTATVALGSQASDFTLRDIDGQQVNLNDYLEDHVVVLHFWTACCASGNAVMPHLKTLHEELAEFSVIVLAVSVDAARNEPQVVAGWFWGVRRSVAGVVGELHPDSVDNQDEV